MSNDQNEVPAKAPNDATFAAEDRVVLEEGVDKKPAKGRATAWFALILSFVALAGVAFMAFENWRNKDDSTATEISAEIERLKQLAGQSDSTVSELRSQIDQINARPQHDFGADIDAVRGDVDDKLDLLGSLPSRMSTIETSVASLTGISAGARETFLLAEAEYYLQIANTQLQLANNPHLAILALGMADERIAQVSDPALIDVRRAISDERTALETMEKPDIEGVTLTLSSLARVVEALPIATTRAQTDKANSGESAEQGNVDRAWQSVKNVMSELVKVTPPEQARLALLSPDAEYFLRNNIAMQLQAARLALLRGEQEIFEQVLEDSSTLLETYFDMDSAQVTSANETIVEIRTTVFSAAPPDISESLRLLRQFNTLKETGE